MIRKIELLSTELLEQNRKLATELKELNFQLALSSGWHYMLDWIWVLNHLGPVEGKTILDAGAGIGLLQWYLAKNGAKIISVDRSNRTHLPYHLSKYFEVKNHTRKNDPIFNSEPHQNLPFTRKAKNLIRGFIGETRLKKTGHHKDGEVQFYDQDLTNLKNIPNNSIDFIVSISALEHNRMIKDVKKIYTELMRVLKPDGTMLVTLPATKEEDWFFEPAHSWCFTEKTLKFIFDINNETKTNFNEYDKLFRKLKHSQELRKNLSWRYYLSPNSGMPWGIWNPRYLPVGVLKRKTKAK